MLVDVFAHRRLQGVGRRHVVEGKFEGNVLDQIRFVAVLTTNGAVPGFAELFSRLFIAQPAGQTFQRAGAHGLFAVLAPDFRGFGEWRKQPEIDIHGLKGAGIGAAGNVFQKCAEGGGGEEGRHDA